MNVMRHRRRSHRTPRLGLVSRRPRREAAVVVALGLTVAAGTLFSGHTAQAEPSSASDVELAKRHFDLGRVYYDQADYDKALTAFEEAYRLSQKPALLFNIGRCHEAAGRLEKAIDHYTRFMRDTGRKDANLRARIRNLKRRLKRRRQREQPKALAPPPPPPKAQPKRSEPKPAPRVSSTSPQAKPPQTNLAEPGPSTANAEQRWGLRQWAGWGLVGLGGASVVTSVILGVLAKRKADRIEEAYAVGRYDWSAIQHFESSGEALEVGQIVFLALGIAATAGGTACLLFWPNAERAPAAISPLAGPDHVGVMGRFSF